jgi:hypothetical protein
MHTHPACCTTHRTTTHTQACCQRAQLQAAAAQPACAGRQRLRYCLEHVPQVCVSVCWPAACRCANQAVAPTPLPARRADGACCACACLSRAPQLCDHARLAKRGGCSRCRQLAGRRGSRGSAAPLLPSRRSFVATCGSACATSLTRCCNTAPACALAQSTLACGAWCVAPLAAAANYIKRCYTVPPHHPVHSTHGAHATLAVTTAVPVTDRRTPQQAVQLLAAQPAHTKRDALSASATTSAPHSRASPVPTTALPSSLTQLASTSPLQQQCCCCCRCARSQRTSTNCVASCRRRRRRRRQRPAAAARCALTGTCRGSA